MKSPLLIIVIIAVVVLPLLLFLTKEENAKPSATPTPSTEASPSATTAALTKPSDAVTASKVILKTTKGNITINLYKDITPNAVMNFATLGKRGYYNNIVFHRIVQEFMIQAGDPNGTGQGGESIYGTSFGVEQNPDHKFKTGSVGMANTGQANSNGSQFFIMTAAEYPSLDGKYTLFGEVADDASMQVVKAIAAVPVTAQPSMPETSKPVNPDEVKITGFDIVE